jgi:hypothetical protein
VGARLRRALQVVDTLTVSCTFAAREPRWSNGDSRLRGNDSPPWGTKCPSPTAVIPAKAGISVAGRAVTNRPKMKFRQAGPACRAPERLECAQKRLWVGQTEIPAFAGMTPRVRIRRAIIHRRGLNAVVGPQPGHPHRRHSRESGNLCLGRPTPRSTMRSPQSGRASPGCRARSARSSTPAATS